MMLMVVLVKLTIQDPCCVPGPLEESKMRMTQSLPTASLTFCKMHELGVQKGTLS